MTAKLVSVLLPVYNSALYLRPAIESILNQTYPHLELLILYDHSEDDSLAIIQSYSDSRIQVMINPEKKGLGYILNLGVTQAKGDYIARMDADDISRPDRLKKQVSFLDNHPEIGVAGSWYQSMNRNKNFIWRGYSDSKEIAAYLFFDSPLAHPTVILRAQVLKDHHLNYDPEFTVAEDWEFWIRCSEFTAIAAIPEPLVQYRILPESTGRSSALEHKRDLADQKILFQNLAKLGLDFEAPDLQASRVLDLRESRGRSPCVPLGTRDFWLLFLEKTPLNHENLERMEEWLRTILDANEQTKIYPLVEFRILLARYYIRLLGNSILKGSYYYYFRSFLNVYYMPTFPEQLKLLFKPWICWGQIRKWILPHL